MHKKDRNKLINVILLLFGILFTGTIGFMIVEKYSFIDAFFMTIITVSTVGYETIQPLSPGGKIFTSFLIVGSLGIFAYGLTSLTGFILEGIFRNYFKRNKVKKRIKKLNKHVIVCGYGRVGKQATIELKQHYEEVVVIDSNEQIIEMIQDEHPNLYYIHGDATQDEVLSEAAIEKAKALITTFPNDADNLFVVLTARQMNPSIKIISRAYDVHSDIKLKRAGATNVIMPDKIGGQRMAKLVSQPDIIEFLEYIMLQDNKDVTIEELSCEKLASCFANKSIRELDIRNISGANIVGLRQAMGNYIINPSPDIILTSEDKLFVLGNSEQLIKLKQILLTGN